jgi:hypothetical protein
MTLLSCTPDRFIWRWSPSQQLIRPLRRGVRRGDRSSKANCEEERSGYGERAKEGFLSRTALVATVTEEASLHGVTFFNDLLVQTTPPFIDQEALTDLDYISYLNSNSISN